jgi:hypothetical protein
VPKSCAKKKEPQPFGCGSLEGCDNLDIFILDFAKVHSLQLLIK